MPTSVCSGFMMFEQCLALPIQPSITQAVFVKPTENRCIALLRLLRPQQRLLIEGDAT